MKSRPHTRLFSHYPLFQLALAYCTGVILNNEFPLSFKRLLLLTIICSLLAVGSFVFRRLTLSGLLVLLAFVFSGASLAAIERTTTSQHTLKQLIIQGVITEQQPVIVTGVVDGPPEFSRDRLNLVLNLEEISSPSYKVPATGVVSLMAAFKSAANREEYRQLNLEYGSRVQLVTSLNRSEKYLNPGVSTITEYLDRKNYDATGLIKTPAAINNLGIVSVFRPLAWLYAWRSAIQREIDENFSPETAGVLDAALLGNRFNLSRSTNERFREAGTFHVLVISGLHISFIGGLVFLLARRLTRKRLVQFITSNVVVWAYTVAVGADTSVARASLMFSLVTLGNVLFRQGSAVNSLGGAALILLIKSPKDLYDPSLQLTFLSVLAIVILAWPLLQTLHSIGSWHPTRETPYPPLCLPFLKTCCECLYWSERQWNSELVRMTHHYRLFKTQFASFLEWTRLQRPLRYIFSSIVVSISVQLVLLPFLIVYFHRVSLSSIVLNIVVGFLLALLSGVALLAIWLNQLSATLAAPLFKLANAIDWVMTHSVDPFARFRVASLRMGEYSGKALWIYVLYYLPLLFLIAVLSRWNPMDRPTATTKKAQHVRAWSAATLQLFMLCLVFWHPFSANRADGKLHVDFLDVGQGDSVLLTMPDGSTLLVDGGGRPTFSSDDQNSFERETRSIGEKVVSEYLWWRGLDSVDYVLATHADADHIDGLSDVIRNFRVRAALVGRHPNDDPEFVKFQQTLASTKTPLEVIALGDELRFGDVRLRVLWPQPSNDPLAPSGNNDSVVLLVQYGERRILLTGDVEKESERQIVVSNDSLKADVVKVGHHGSRTSSTEGFVKATSPRYAVISVGRTSMFGHPHQDVVERWKTNGAAVLTTGTSGTISVTTDGKELSLSEFVREKP